MDEKDFTPRQKEVLEEMCKGKSNKEIARALNMAEATVKLHLTEIFRTMGVNTRTQAILRASDFAITVQVPPREVSDLDILKEFTDLAFTVGAERWCDRVVKFGHAINKLAKG